MQSWEKYTPQMLSILRIVAALIFIEHGTQKLWAFPGPPPSGNLPAIMSLGGAAALLEVILGPLLLVGIYTRWMAFILSGEMAFAYWISHFPRNFWPILNNGDAAILYCFVFLFIACAGVGAWGLDRSLRGTSG
jgi:putative oxidoreductase